MTGGIYPYNLGPTEKDILKSSEGPDGSETIGNKNSELITASTSEGQETTGNSGNNLENPSQGLSNQQNEKTSGNNEDNSKSTPEGQEISQVDEKFRDSPYYPILQRLKQYVSEEQFQNAEKSFQEAESKEEAKEIVLRLVNSVSDPKIREEYTELLEGKKEKIDENNFENTEFAKDAKISNLKLNVGIGGLEIMLAENYVSAPVPTENDNTEDKEENFNKEDDIKTAMDVVTNKIIEENSPEFKQNNGPLISDIRKENNLQKKYDLVKDLYKENLKKDAEQGGTKAKNEIKMKQDSLITQAKKLSDEFKKAQEMPNGPEKFKELERIQEEFRRINEEGRGIDNFEGDIKNLTGGEDAGEKEISPETPQNNEAL